MNFVFYFSSTPVYQQNLTGATPLYIYNSVLSTGTLCILIFPLCQHRNMSTYDSVKQLQLVQSLLAKLIYVVLPQQHLRFSARRFFCVFFLTIRFHLSFRFYSEKCFRKVDRKSRDFHILNVTIDAVDTVCASR